MNAVKKFFLRDFVWALVFPAGVALYIYNLNNPILKFYTRENPFNIIAQIFLTIFLIFFLLFYMRNYKNYSRLEIIIAFFQTLLLSFLLISVLIVLAISYTSITQSHLYYNDFIGYGTITIILALFYMAIATYSAKLGEIKLSIIIHIIIFVSCLLIIYFSFLSVGTLFNMFYPYDYSF